MIRGGESVWDRGEGVRNPFAGDRDGETEQRERSRSVSPKTRPEEYGPPGSLRLTIKEDDSKDE
jgi:hypothetical protein